MLRAAADYADELHLRAETHDGAVGHGDGEETAVPKGAAMDSAVGQPHKYGRWLCRRLRLTIPQHEKRSHHDDEDGGEGQALRQAQCHQRPVGLCAGLRLQPDPVRVVLVTGDALGGVSGARTAPTASTNATVTAHLASAAAVGDSLSMVWLPLTNATVPKIPSSVEIVPCHFAAVLRTVSSSVLLRSSSLVCQYLAVLVSVIDPYPPEC